MSLIDAAFTVRVLISSLFLIAGISKILTHNRDSVDLLRGAGLTLRLPQNAPLFFGVAELGLGLWLASGWESFAGLIVAVLLLACFALIMLRALQRGYVGGCGCFLTPSKSRRLSLALDVGSDAIFLSAGLFALITEAAFGPSTARSITSLTGREILSLAVIAIALVGLNFMAREIDMLAHQQRRGDTE